MRYSSWTYEWRWTTTGWSLLIYKYIHISWCTVICFIFVRVNFNSKYFVWKIFINMFYDENIRPENFLKAFYFTREISWMKLIFRSRLTCKRKDVDSIPSEENKWDWSCWLSSTFPNFSSSSIFDEKISAFLRLMKIFQHEKKKLRYISDRVSCLW